MVQESVRCSRTCWRSGVGGWPGSHGQGHMIMGVLSDVRPPRAKLASLFGLDQDGGQGNQSFQYTAPKQPRKSSTPGEGGSSGGALRGGASGGGLQGGSLRVGPQCPPLTPLTVPVLPSTSGPKADPAFWSSSCAVGHSCPDVQIVSPSSLGGGLGGGGSRCADPPVSLQH